MMPKQAGLALIAPHLPANLAAVIPQAGPIWMLVYFKGRWPEKIVPEGAPSWLYYEIDQKHDVVTRTIDLFSNGLAVRNSIKLAEREGLDQREPRFRSLVHGPFLEETREWLDGISECEFVELWEAATDKPWP